jgi:WD40 repeat protein
VLASGGNDGAVRLWTPAGERLAELTLGEPVSGLAFHPDGGRLLAAQSGAGVAALTAPA